MQEGRGGEVMALGSGGGAGGHLQGIKYLWSPPGDDDLHPIPRASDLGGRQRLSGVGQ